ncbi:TadG family pilus assembly protein [Parvularcula bermudensis]|nr:TadG family pilus assembly protein [Parvularcula bermudensis]
MIRIISKALNADRHARRLAHQRGSIATLLMILLVPSLGLSALIVDGSRMRNAYLELEIVAESAALAAAQQLPDTDAATSAAVDYAETNLDPTVYGEVVKASDIEFGQYDEASSTFTSGGDATAVKVTARREAERGNSLVTLFGAVIGRKEINLSATAIALLDYTEMDPVCILALGHHLYGVDMDILIDVDIPDCGIQVNSDSHTALKSRYNAEVNAAYIHVVGQVHGNTNLLNPTPVEGVDPVDDPYADLAEPVLKPCGGVNFINGGTHTLTDTYRFCSGLYIHDADVTLSPGEYQISGHFDLHGTSSISGTDVTLFIEGHHSRIYFHRFSTFDLQAPTTGPYAGIVMWSARDNTQSHEFYSRFDSSSSGSFYFPAAKMDIEDKAIWASDCLRIVSWTLDFSPRSTFSATSPGSTCSNNIYPEPGEVRLVH